MLLLVTVTSTKSHTVCDWYQPKVVTMNDLELRNGHYFAFYFAEFGSFGANYIKVIEVGLINCATEM